MNIFQSLFSRFCKKNKTPKKFTQSVKSSSSPLSSYSPSTSSLSPSTHSHFLDNPLHILNPSNPLHHLQVFYNTDNEEHKPQNTCNDSYQSSYTSDNSCEPSTTSVESSSDDWD